MIHENNLKKPLDKRKQACYNKYNKGEEPQKKGNDTMMFKIEMENWMMIHEAITNDFATALDDLAIALDDETACGHIIDMETGEVLVHIECGEVVYISLEVKLAMLQAVFDEVANDVVMAIMWSALEME